MMLVVVGVLTNTGTTSKRVAEKFKFQFCATQEADVFDENTNTVFVATRHDSHGSYVLKSLKANKNVFVEKPLCLLESELEEIIEQQSKLIRLLWLGLTDVFRHLLQS